MKQLVRVNWKRFLFQLNILGCKWSILYLTVEKKKLSRINWNLLFFFFFLLNNSVSNQIYPILT